MTDDNFFKFNKDKQMDYSTFKMKIDENSVADENVRKLFNIFDVQKEDGTAGKDGILSGKEVQNFWDKVKQYATKNQKDTSVDKDDTLDSEETAMLLEASFGDDVGSLKDKGFNIDTLMNALNVIQEKIVPNKQPEYQIDIIKKETTNPKKIEPPKLDIVDLKFTNDGKCIYTVKSGKYFVDVVNKLGSEDSEQIFYDAKSLDEIQKGTAKKVYRISIKDGKQQHYFIAPDGKEYTPEQIQKAEDRMRAEQIKAAAKTSLDVEVDKSKLPLKDAETIIPFMLSGDSQGQYIREDDKIYTKDDKGEKYLVAEIIHGTRRKIIIYADKERTQGWEYYINNPENPKFNNYFVTNVGIDYRETTGYGNDHKSLIRTTYFSDHTEITQQIFDNSNQILLQNCWLYNKQGKNTSYRIDDYNENTYLVMSNSSANTSTVYDRDTDEVKFKYEYTRDAEGNITKALAIRQDGTIIQSKSYGYNFVQLDALFKVMIPFDTQKGIGQYAGLTQELSNVLANAMWHKDSGIYDVTAENHPIFLYFASLDETTQKKVAKLIKDNNIRTDVQLQVALVNAGITLNIPNPIVDVNKGKSALRIEHEETATLVTQAYDNAIAVLEAHLQELKDNAFTNLGEIFLEDARFWGPKLNCIGLDIIGIGPDRAIKEISKRLDNGTVKALITSIHTEIDELKAKRAKCTTLMNLAGTASGKYNETYSDILHGKQYNPANLQEYKEKCQRAQTLLDKVMQRSSLGVEYAKAKNQLDTNKAIEIIGRAFKEGSKEFNAIKNTPEYKEYKQLIENEISVARRKVTGNVEKEVEDYISGSSAVGMVAETVAFIVLTWGAGAELAGASWAARGATLAKAFGGYTAVRQSLNLLDDVDNWVKGDKTVLGSFVGEDNAKIVKDIFSDDSSFSALHNLSYDDFRASRGGHITVDSLASGTFGFVAGVTSPWVAKLAEYPTKGVANMLGVDVKAFTSSQNVIAKATENALPKGSTSAAKFIADSQEGIMKTALKEACGISSGGSKFANIAALAKYGGIQGTRFVSHLLMETVLFSGVDISQSIVGDMLSENNKDFQKACQEGTIVEYVGKKLAEQGVNLASIRAISTVLAMTLLSRPGNPMVKEFNKFDSIKNADVETTKNGSVVVSVKDGGKVLFTEFTMDVYDKDGKLTRTVEFPDNDMPPAQRAYSFLRNMAYTEFLYKQPTYTYSQQKAIGAETNTPQTDVQSQQRVEVLDSENPTPVEKPNVEEAESIPTSAEASKMNFEQMFNRLKSGHVNYTLLTTQDGRHLVKIENCKTLSANRFDYYEFDKEGKLVKSQVKTSEATAKDMFKGFENADSRDIQNRGGNLNAGIPVVDIAEGVDASITARNVRNEIGNSENAETTYRDDIFASDGNTAKEVDTKSKSENKTPYKYEPSTFTEKFTIIREDAIETEFTGIDVGNLMPEIKEVCKIGDKYSYDLVKLCKTCVEKCSDLWELSDFIKICNDLKKDGQLNTDAVKLINASIASGTDFKIIFSMLKSSFDKNGNFDKNLFQQLGSLRDKNSIVNIAEVIKDGDGNVSNDLLEHVFELESMGFDNADAAALLELCTIEHESEGGKVTKEFSQEVYDKIPELLNKGYPANSIEYLLRPCVKDGKINQSFLDYAIQLLEKGFKISDLVEIVECLGASSDRELIADKSLEFAKKHNLEISKACDVLFECLYTEDGSYGDNLDFSKIKFDERKYNFANEIMTRNPEAPRTVEKCVRAVSLNYKFEPTMLESFNKLRELGYSDDNAARLLGKCINDRDSSEKPETFNQHLFDKIQQWDKLTLEQLGEDFIKEFGVDKNSIADDIKKILYYIDQNDNIALDYVDEFIKADAVDIDKLIECSTNYQTAKMDHVIMEEELTLLKEYKLKTKTIASVLRTINKTKENFDILNQLLKDGLKLDEDTASRTIWNMIDNKNNFNKDKVKYYSKYLKEGLSTYSICHALRVCDERNMSDKAPDMLEVLSALPKDKADGQVEKLPYIIHLLESKDLMLGAIESAKQNDASLEDVFKVFSELASRKLYELLCDKADIDNILTKLKESPKDANTLIEIINARVTGNVLKVWLSHPEDIATLRYSYTADYDWMAAIDSESEPLDIVTLLNASEKLGNYHNLKPSDVSPEVITSIKEYLKATNYYVSLQFFDFKNPNTAKVLDGITDYCKKNGKLSDFEIHSISELSRTYYNKDGIYSNLREIIEFVTEYDEFVETTQNKPSSEVSEKDKAILTIISDFKDITNRSNKFKYDSSEELPQSSELDIATLRKAIQYAGKLKNPQRLAMAFRNVEDWKNVVDVLDKVDLEKYGEEIELLLKEGNNNGMKALGIFSYDIPKKYLEFILETQKMLCEKAKEKNKRPQILTRDFVEIFTKGEIPEEALNKLAFYIENQLSLDNPQPYDGSYFYHGAILDIPALKAIMNIYTLRPDKIEQYENLLFNAEGEDINNNIVSVIKNLSSDKAVLDKQLQLLDDMMKTGLFFKNALPCLDIFKGEVTTVEDVEAKSEVWNATKQNFRKNMGDMRRLLENTNQINKNVVLTLCENHTNIDILAHIAYNTKADNAALVEKLCSDKDFPKDKIADIAGTIRADNVALVEKLCFDKDFPKEQIAPIANRTHAANVTLIEKLCFNKDFPKDKIADIAYETNAANVTLIEKLCFNKDLPKDKIADIACVISQYNTTLAEKLFFDENIKFSDEQKIKILKSVRNHYIEDADAYINNIQYGVEHGCSIETASAYAKYGNVLESMKIRENIMKHAKTLKQHGIESDEKAIDIMLTTKESTANGHYDGGISAVGLDGVNELLKITDMTTIENATQLKFTGFKNFLIYGSLLSRLSPENYAKLKEVLAEFPYPEQRVQKLQVVTSLIGNISETELTELIDQMEAPTMTTAQKDAATKIFSPENKKTYSEKIEDFIKEFNVPQAKADNIRKWLNSAQLDTKFVTPKPIEEQIQDIDKRIENNERIINSGKIPEEKLEKMRANNDALKAQKEDMLAHPEKYTATKLNDKQMQELENKVRDLINYPNQTKVFVEKTLKILYAKLGFENPSKDLLDAIDYDFKYFARLFAGLDNPGWESGEGYTFKSEFTKLINLINENPGKKLTEARMTIPANQKTKEMFKENGLDFEFWNKFDENFKYQFETIIKKETAVAEVLNNLKGELETDLFKTFDEKEREQLLEKIKTAVEALPKTDDPVANNLQEANTILSVIETELKENEYWVKNAKMFSDHIKGHHKEVRDAKDIKDREVMLYVRLSDSDDIGRNIFFGDHIGCCTSVGGGNAFAAPQHLQNAFVRGYEMVDEQGISYGNSMCFFAKVDGKLTFVIDSFEANGTLVASKDVPDALIKFAHMVCEREGRPDAQIMFGPNYNKLEGSRFNRTSGHTVEIVGTAPEDTYIDSMGGFGDIDEPNKTSMNEIIE